MMELSNWSDSIFWVDYVLFLFFVLSVGYVFIFALASLKKVKIHYPKAKKNYKYAVIVPTRRGMDQYIHQCIDSLLQQNYPKECFDVVIIANGLTQNTLHTLNTMPVIVFEKPTSEGGRKTALEYAINQLESSAYDSVIVMNPNNTVDIDYLSEINKAMYSGCKAIQTHRTTRKFKTTISLLSALSEEINNSLFRRGHVNMGLSSSLIGSGMIFDYKWFSQNIGKLGSPGLTKLLEARLLKQGIFVEYLENVYIYEEKTKNVSAYGKERQEWSKSKRYTTKDTLKDLPKAFFAGNFDFCDKVFQWLLPSKVLLPGYLIIIALLLSSVEFALALKWWILLGALLFSYSLSIPDRFLNFRTIWAFILLPIMIVSIIANKVFSRFGKS